MILSRSIKLSVLVLSFACLGISSTSVAATCATTKCTTSECETKCNCSCPGGCCTEDCATKCSTKCSTAKRCMTRCEGSTSAQQLLMDAGSLSLSVLTYYLYASKIRPSLVSKVDDSNNEVQHSIVEDLCKAVASVWFVDQAKDFLKSLRCYLLGKAAPVIQEAQSLVGQ